MVSTLFHSCRSCKHRKKSLVDRLSLNSQWSVWRKNPATECPATVVSRMSNFNVVELLGRTTGSNYWGERRQSMFTVCLGNRKSRL